MTGRIGFLEFLLFMLMCCVIVDETLGSPLDVPRSSRVKRKVVQNVPCVENGGKFYRNSNTTKPRDCARYYQCVRQKVLEFKCSSGLYFDVERQICDFKSKVHNCETASDTTTPRPLLSTDEPICPSGDLACADGKCMGKDLFCDGQVDCNDGSDEAYCELEFDPNATGRCDFSNCSLPDCFCSADGTRIPGELTRDETPQMILLTFDDAINNENWDIYQKIFSPNRTNPNGCPIRATFFLSHEYTNYRHVQKMWNDGHEMAVHSISHRQPELWWSNKATLEDWFDEFAGQANIINRFAGVPIEELRGIRVPFLRVGWNTQFIMMKEFGFLYDSTMVAPSTDPPLWPYTLDYRIPHKCTGARQKCPSRAFPGIFEMVMNPLNIEGHICAMVDSCPTHLSEDEVLEMLMENFNRHYRSNKAPFGLYFHTVWFKEKHNLRSLLRFLDEMKKKQDVYIVTNYNAIQWIREPTPLSGLNNFQPWKCDRKFEPSQIACNHAKLCKLNSRHVRGGERFMHTCFECPDVYPWVKNEFGLEF